LARVGRAGSLVFLGGLLRRSRGFAIVTIWFETDGRERVAQRRRRFAGFGSKSLHHLMNVLHLRR
jgi:hypothetical protein